MALWQLIVNSHVLLIIVTLFLPHVPPILPDLRIHLLQIIVGLDMQVSLQVGDEIRMPIRVQFGIHPPHETHLRLPYTLPDL